MAKQTKRTAANMKVESGQMPYAVASFRFKKETKGAILYEEIDANGEPTTVLSGSLYLRKAAFPGGEYPTVISVSVAIEP